MRWPLNLKGMSIVNKLEYRLFWVCFFPQAEEMAQWSRITNNQMFKLFIRKQTKCNYF